MNISINAEKTFEKMQHVLMTKVLERMGMKGTCLNIIKAIYDKVRANIIRNAEKIEVISLKSEQDRAIHCPHWFSI